MEDHKQFASEHKADRLGAADWQILLRPIPSTIPCSVRIRRLLKSMLRVYGLRCLSVRTQARPRRRPAREGHSRRNAEPAVLDTLRRQWLDQSDCTLPMGTGELFAKWRHHESEIEEREAAVRDEVGEGQE